MGGGGCVAAVIVGATPNINLLAGSVINEVVGAGRPSGFLGISGPDYKAMPPPTAGRVDGEGSGGVAHQSTAKGTHILFPESSRPGFGRRRDLRRLGFCRFGSARADNKARRR